METKRTRSTIDLLKAVEQIADKAKGSGLNADFYRKAARYIKYIGEKLSLTREQCVLMALFVDNGNYSNITLKDLADFAGCRTTRMLRYQNDIDELEHRELVCCSRSNRKIHYRVPLDVIEAFRKDEVFVPAPIKDLTCDEFFARLDILFDQRDDNEITYAALQEKALDLLRSNQQLVFAQKALDYELDGNELMLLLLFCHLAVNEDDDCINLYQLEDLYDNKSTWRYAKRMLLRDHHDLQVLSLIEYGNSDGMADRESFCLTRRAKDELLSEVELSSANKERQRSNVIKAKNIREKRLFFSKAVARQVDELGRLLDEDNYRAVCERLRGSNFRCGMACLFYGAPGTGKTETVMQLARRTGRDIMQVNISEIKSMWVGESEKNIKSLFDKYRSLVKERSLAPILLFNEADAVIGQRHEGAKRAVDKMENTLQNIILQEMETLEGILIATTNLAGNMDNAFERRFLYKINFTAPTVEARTAIWQTMLPDLAAGTVEALAERYDFSGGQIENIARHYTIDRILHGDSAADASALFAHCDAERLEKTVRHTIGFHTA